MSMNFLGGMQGEEHASGGVARRRNGEPAGEPAFDPGAASPGGGGEERPFVPGSLKQDLKRLQDRIPAHQVQLVCLVIITACLVVGALHWLRPVLVPLIIALVLKNMLAPIVDVLVRRLQFPKVLAVLAAISVGIGVLVLLGSVAASSVRELTRKDNMRLYKEAAEALVRKTTHVFDKLSDTHQGLADMGKEQFGDLPVGETVVKMTNSLVQEVIGLAELAFLVLVFSIYMLQGYDPYAPARRGAVGKVETRLKKYLIIKTLVSAMLGMLVGLLLLTLNVPLVGIFTFANFALNFIPNIGPTVATMMPIPLMLFSREARGVQHLPGVRDPDGPAPPRRGHHRAAADGGPAGAAPHHGAAGAHLLGGPVGDAGDVHVGPADGGLQGGVREHRGHATVRPAPRRAPRQRGRGALRGPLTRGRRRNPEAEKRV